MPRAVSGFTLIELIVVLAIIGVITALVLTSQSQFNRTLVLANTAYDMGLAFRYAETYGIGTRALGSISNAGYGLHFDRGVTTSFSLFADSYPATTGLPLCHPLTNGASAPDARPGDCVYEKGSDPLVTTYSIGNGITIADFCADTLAGWSCANSGSASLSSLDIVFARPNPDPYIRYNGSSGNVGTAACIALSAGPGSERYVSVAASGEINPNAAPCP